MLKLLLWSALSVLVSAEVVCPDRCLCVKSTVRCLFLQLDQIPEDIPRKTTILDLRFNKLTNLPPDSFKGMSNLSTVLLNNNKIQSVENGAFQGLQKLKYLYLYKNAIQKIGSKAFKGLTKLQQLYLHFNEIDNLDPETFKELHLLERLFLHNNRLKTIPQELLSGLSTLRRLRLDANALVCNCDMKKFIESLKENYRLTDISATCGFPADLKGKSLLAVRKNELHCKKPTFLKEPQDLEVQFGEIALLHCQAQGDPNPDITWLHNNENILLSRNGSSRYSLLEDGSLKIDSVSDDDVGQYNCVAQNIIGQTRTRSVYLKTETTPVVRNQRQIQNKVRPRITLKPKDYSVVVGETVKLDCHSRGQPQPSLRWTKNDLPLPAHSRIQFKELSGSLVIEKVQYSDRGLYRCTATNEEGSTSETGRLEVLVAPTFEEIPTVQNVIVGQSAFFSCRADGTPKPTISWLQDGQLIQEQPRYTLSAEGNTLWITKVTLADRGVFDCVAESTAGKNVASAQLLVKKKLPPVLRSHPQDAQAFIGANVRFHCSVSADPPPSITWFKNGAALSTSGKYEIQANEESLLIRNVVFRDEGTYECVAENVAGSVRAFATLTVFDDTFGRTTAVINNEVLVNTITEARNEVDMAFNNTLRDLLDNSKPRTPQDLLAIFRLPSAEALEITRSAEIFERTIESLHRQVSSGATYNISHKEIQYEDILTPSQLTIVANLSNCAAHRRVVLCDNMCYHHKYRSLDGTCNNLRHTMWGASLTPLNRLLSPSYENGFNTPRGWSVNKLYQGFPLPSARLVSIELASAGKVTDDKDYTHMLMQWGQFLDHDMSFVPMAVSNSRFSDGRHCNETCENHSPCFPIPVPSNDPRIRRHRCLGVTRSSAMCGSGMTSIFFHKPAQREQLNQITSYIDASNVYGSRDNEAESLRDLSTQTGYLQSGLLMPSGKPLLPPNNGEPVDCQMDPNKAHFPCFQAGDHRANEQLGLLSLHTLFLREHNRIAEALRRLNPLWDGDMLFHEARKIVGAQMQHITYHKWLPKILGKKGMAMLGSYKGYDPSVDATVINSFSTAAFRFGHSLINPVIYRLNSTFQPVREGNLPLHKAFFAPFRIIEEGGIDPVIRGLIGRSAKLMLPNELLNKELTEGLFKLAHEVALDLAALNIQRGRDHGIPTYNTMRHYCNLHKADTFSNMKEIKESAVRQKLKRLYGHPDNVDLWIGALLEEPVEGAKLGPTLMCILVEQFRRTRDGDRFWYENPGVFSSSQLAEIRQVTLARIICDNSDDIDAVQKDVFTKVDFPTGYLQCRDDFAVPKIDLKVWAHCCQDCSRAGSFHSITSHYRGRRSADDSDQREQELNYSTKLPSNLEDHDNHIETENAQQYNVKQNIPPVKEPPSYQDTIAEKVTFLSQKSMDSIDHRIEGIEELVDNLQNHIEKFKKRIRYLEQKTKSRWSHPEAVCSDEQGYLRRHGQRWREQDCNVCSCHAGQVVCNTEKCQLSVCQDPLKIKKDCCCPVSP